jgi:hypothetical protein
LIGLFDDDIQLGDLRRANVVCGGSAWRCVADTAATVMHMSRCILLMHCLAWTPEVDLSLLQAHPMLKEAANDSRPDFSI